MSRSVELLTPAGSFRNLQYAIAYGADAVYAGQPRYSLRVRNNDFTLENLAKGIEYAHQYQRKFFVASNILPHNSKIKTYMADMEPVIAMQPDALIMADPGLIMMVRERWPETEIHLSVQANAVNYAAVNFWKSVGIKRVILSRELSLDEVEEIRQKCPDIELEVFVHGALCIAYSGRCLLSGYANHRDPNQGSCTNSCRWKYDAHAAQETAEGNYSAIEPELNFTPPTLGEGRSSDQVYLLQEQNRPGEYMPAFEDEHGTYIMNSKDLRAVQHVQRLIEMGIDSLKIEGRTKSHYYVARTTQVYRKAIDQALQGKSFDMSLMDDLEKLSNRGYTEGFYRRHVHDQYQSYEQGTSIATKQQFVGEVVSVDHQLNMITVEAKNRFEIGDSIEVMSPTGNQHITLQRMETEKGEPVEAAPGSGHIVRIPLNTELLCTKTLLLKEIKAPVHT
ncbi:MAG: tRNA 5-hydroxyuridine modification protein YegQ [Gammaproteobacteria bacterium]|nr:tRNA 5-hydroxyuridine modification protein YegQ [Gammaproteobacteria bacterium]MBL7001118.1 tRNA 5-hydroxyuridine modification protein YegQ [Gammaproteobacteria bacterium]